MAYQLRTADPRSDEGLVALLDHAFQRPDRESRLVRTLSEHMPSFDPGLSLVASKDDRDVAFALFLPRRFRFRGCEVPLVISSPFCALPEVRGQGAGRFLLETGLAALGDRGIRGALVLGGSGFFQRNGYLGAFNLYTIDAQRELAAAGPSEAEWGGLTAEDIPELEALYAANYAGVTGSEVRTSAPIDWESSSEGAYTVVSRREGRPAAYLRFRVREKLAVMECGARDQAAVNDVRAFIRRLAEEHNRASVEVHLPPPHPVFRALFRAGCMAEGNSFHDEARLRITNWRGFLEDVAPSFGQALAMTKTKAVSLAIETPRGTETFGLEQAGKGPVEVTDQKAKLHLELPAGWAEPLMTGRLDWRDLYFAAGPGSKLREDFGRELLSLLFPSGTPMWTYSPVFEIADE